MPPILGTTEALNSVGDSTERRSSDYNNNSEKTANATVQILEMAPKDVGVQSAPSDMGIPQPIHFQESSKSPLKSRSSTAGASNLTKHHLKPTATAQTYHPKLRGRTWQPGQEPGISANSLHWPKHDCDITVVNFSPEKIRVYDLDNDNLGEFLQNPKEDWVTCQWINVNGISSDVIQLLARFKNFHRLAIEDMVNNKNRTKADWYTDHTYSESRSIHFMKQCSGSDSQLVVLPLQKLVLGQGYDSDSDGDEDLMGGKAKGRGKKSVANRLLTAIAPSRTNGRLSQSEVLSSNPETPGKGFRYTTKRPRPTRTLQRFHAGPNEERTNFMERQSALTSKGLAVSVEQVSIFLTSDNCVVSFFESSAPDVENPIVERLQSSGTLIRRSADASMILQAIVDAIIDLAIPVTTAYQDAVEELELNVLTGIFS